MQFAFAKRCEAAPKRLAYVRHLEQSLGVSHARSENGMSCSRRNGCGIRHTAALSLALTCMRGSSAQANQFDIHGPKFSVAFGNAVTALPNGNIVVSDPDYGPNGKNFGAVYLYSPRGKMISVLRGSSTDDHVGSYGIKVMANGSFVVLSPSWSYGNNAAAGAVTWVDGDAGLSGVVSAANSLVGTQANDSVGNGGVTLLTKGNAVVASSSWSNGAATGAGAVTWINGHTGLSGAVSIENSLVGAETNEGVGAWQVFALTNGKYVVPDPNWQYAAGRLGAVILADGNTGATGTFSASNSLTGAIAGDSVGSGGVVALPNGNYVVSSPTWNNGSVQMAGAVTWVDGTTGLIDHVSAGNSLVGTSFLDQVGSGIDLHPIVALTNGNYVVTSMWWDGGGGIRNVGAVTWGNGNTGTTGAISVNNSLVGSVEDDWVGIDRVAALSDGNYVVGSRYWHNGPVEKAGAVTWADGTAGLYGAVSASNSLVGASVFDWIGSQGTRALRNGNYVVTSPRWSDSEPSVGAITWASGTGGLTGPVSSGNSLIGSTAGDSIGAFNVVVLSNGNYVVDSPFWNNGSATKAGAVTWADGTTGLLSTVSASNSLVGTSANDQVGYNGAAALTNGNYVVASPGWSNGPITSVGAVTWGNGNSGISGAITAANSLIGTTTGDSVGSGFDNSNGFQTYSNGAYIVASPHFHNGSIVDAGAVSLIRGTGGTVGAVSAENSVIGTSSGVGLTMVFDYDPAYDTLVVGQPASNLVSLFKADLLFANGFQ